MKFIIFCTKFCFRNVACSQIAKRLEVFHFKVLMLLKIAQTEHNFTAATPINAIPKPYPNCFHESNHSKTIVLKTSNAQIHTISGSVAITITNFERKTSNDFHDFCQRLLCLKKLRFPNAKTTRCLSIKNACFVRIIKKWIEFCCGHLYKYNAKTVAQMFSQIKPFANHSFFNFKSTNSHFWYFHRDQSIRFWMKNIEWKN